MLKDLVFTLSGLRAAYAAGISAGAVMAETYGRLRAVADPGIFIHLMDEAEAVAIARSLGPYQPDLQLWGVPFAVKDNIDVAGMPTTAACPAFAYSARHDAFVVARLRAAGAIPIGKTNLDQFATGLVGVRSPYAVPRNATDPDLVPGGSSSGSAVAVGQGIVAFSLGTDTAGSGRVPAAFNNIVGLKPTLGALSATGVVPACRTLDTISVFARTVADAHTVFRVAAAEDLADPYSKPVRAGAMPAPLPCAHIGVPDAASLVFFGDDAQKASFAQVVARLKAGGARTSEIDFSPFYAVARMLYDGAWVAERHAVIEDLLASTPGAVHPVTRAIISKATSLSATDAFRGFYRLEGLKRACAPALASVDMLCVPTIPTFYTCADLANDPVTPNSNLGTYTNFVNLLDLAAIAVPTPLRMDGRPGSVTLIGRAGRDGELAAQAQRIQSWTTSREEAIPAEPEPGGDEIALAVCGAHMSGLPLNHELTGRGGRFLRAARSAPVYGFYALAGGPPVRPGLVRLVDGQGTRVGLEIWSLPKAAFGDFMAGIPAPLGIGTMELEDGSFVKGFLCETAGLTGSRDVSAFGDWRAFLASLS